MADTSQYYTDPATGTVYTSYAAYQQYNPGGSTSQPDSTTIDLSRGDQFFVRFPDSHGATVYLYDKNRKIFVPFTSESGFAAFAGKSPEQAAQNGEIHDLNSNVIDQMGTIVPDQYGFNDQGQVSNSAYFDSLPDTSGLAGHYGMQQSTDLETKAATKLWTFAQFLKNNGAITQATFDKYVADPTQFAVYINAAAYGGYSAGDILRDLKAKDLGLTNVKTFDTTQTATQFYQTPEHALSANNAQLALPANLNMDPGLLNNPVFSIPDAAFQTLVPVLDKNSQSYKDQVSAVQDTYHDLLLQQLDATTAQEKAIADTNYKQFQDQLQQKFGITLSDNAQAAWGQLQQLSNAAENNNMADSGVFNQAVDDALAHQRLIDSRVRTDESNQANTQKQTYYTTQATPQQIQNDLTPAERQAWGLTPTQETLDFINNLATTYPGITADQIKQIKDSMIDENGNRRSTLYANLFQNRLTQTQAKTTLQEQTVQQQNDAANQKAYAPYTPSDNPFIRDTSTVTNPAAPTTTPPTTTNAPFSYSNNAPGIGSSENGSVSESDVKSALSNPNAASIAGGNSAPSNPGSSSTPGISTPGIQDLSSKYGLYKGTVYNLSTGLGYSSPTDFFKESGITDFSQAKLNNSYAPSFYKYDKAYNGNSAATVYSGATNKPLDYNTYLKSGGTTDFSGVQTRTVQ